MNDAFRTMKSMAVVSLIIAATICLHPVVLERRSSPQILSR